MTAPMRSRATLTAFAMLAAASTFLGGAMVTAKIAVAGVPPVTVAASRFTLAAVILLVVRALVPRLRGTTNRPRLADLPLIAALGATAAAGYNLLLLSGVRLAPASDAALVAPAVAPVVSTILAAVFLADRPSRVGLVGLGVSILGIGLVISPAGRIDAARLLGDGIFVAAGALFGSYLVISRLAARRFSALDITLLGTLAAVVMLLPLSLLEGGPSLLLAAPAPSVLAIVHLAALATVAAFVLLNEGLRRLGVARSAGFTLMIPIFGVLQAMLILHEPLAPTAMGGAAIVLGGLWVAQGGRLPTVPAPWRLPRRATALGGA